MKAAIKTEVLKSVLNHLSVATESRTPLPILGSVLIQFEKAIATFSATNLDLYIREKVTESNELNVKTSGGVCVSLRLLKQFVARAESKSVLFELKDKHLIVSYAQNVANLEWLPVEEFPTSFQIESDQEINCHATSLTAPLRRVAHAISFIESQYHLTGVNLHRNSAGSEFCATDQKRIAICKSPLALEGEDIIVPGQAVQAIIKLIETGECTVKSDGKVISIVNGNLEVQSRLVEAKFPRYQSVIPTPADKAFSASRKELIEALNTAAIFMRQNEIEVRLQGKDKEVEVSCFDRFKTKLIGTELNGQPDATTRINYRYLLDALNSCEKESVRIEYVEGQPLAIRDGDFIEVMNPLIDVNVKAPVKEPAQAGEEKQEEIPF